jgi:hypothetical protein
MSPNQLFISGILASESRTRSILEEIVNPSQFGVEEDGTPLIDNDEGVVMCDPPELNFLLTPAQELDLTQAIEQITEDDYNI